MPKRADLMPTILDLCGVAAPGTRHGWSLLPVLRGDAAHVREVCISTTSLATPAESGERPSWDYAQ